jgi:predicted MFS family arabinose efflux permease
MTGSAQPQAAHGQRWDKRAYYHLYFAQVLALLSTGIGTIALALLAYKLAGGDAGAVLGTAFAIKMLAYFGIAPIAAAFVQRLPRRGLLVGLDLVRAAIVFALPFVTQVWQVYVLIFTFQAASAVFTPVFQSTIPDLVPEEKAYTKALARSSLAHELENVVSPLLAAALLAVTTFRGVFLAAVFGLLVSAALILAVTLPRSIAATRGSPRDRLTRGLAIFLATPRLRGLLAINLAVAATIAMVTVSTVVLVQARFGLTEEATALALVAFGAGSVLAALVLPRLLEAIPDRTAMLTGAGLAAAGLLGGIALPNYGVLLPLWFALGLGCTLGQTPAGGLLRRSAAREERQYLYAAQFALANGCLLITYPLAGWLSVGIGLKMDFAALGLMAAAAVLVAVRLWPHPDSQVAESVVFADDDRAWRAGGPE